MLTWKKVTQMLNDYNQNKMLNDQNQHCTIQYNKNFLARFAKSFFEQFQIHFRIIVVIFETNLNWDPLKLCHGYKLWRHKIDYDLKTHFTSIALLTLQFRINNDTCNF